MLQAVLPGGYKSPQHQYLLQHIPELVELRILRLQHQKGAQQSAGADEKTAAVAWDSACEIGFPSPPVLDDWKGVENRETIKQAASLSGSTKTAAKRRLAALKRSLKARSSKTKEGCQSSSISSCDVATSEEPGALDVDQQTADSKNNEKPMLQKDWDFESHEATAEGKFEEELCDEAKLAVESLQTMFRFEKRAPKGKNKAEISTRNAIPEYILPKQASYSGSHPSQTSEYGELSKEAKERIPTVVLEAFGICCSGDDGGQGKTNQRRLYSHQAKAISSAVQERHTLVCTSTGSGKSLCFLIPALAAAYNASVVGGPDDPSARGISLLMFPTKALAQDQLTKLKAVLSKNDELSQHIIPATLDGDCPHAQRSHIAKHANIILTNPDTLHASILPQWKKLYRRVLAGLKYVVIDEGHVYEGGIFGTHVALILSRLQRLCMAARCDQGGDICTPTFLSSSATLEHPEYHMRFLCPIPSSCEINVLTAKDDGAPRSAKHFFVWNPPLLTMAGENIGSVFYPRALIKKGQAKSGNTDMTKKRHRPNNSSSAAATAASSTSSELSLQDLMSQQRPTRLPRRSGDTNTNFNSFHRRHAAEETALLLARAVSNNIRCIAFCKTRSLVEWVYDLTVTALRSEQSTKHLAEQVQPYRGGYKLSDRREIEKMLFDDELLGVVATSALELGVDIGGIELTLHVGYPSSISSLLQQAGRAGRGGATLEKPSLSVVVCFGSPAEQYLWKKPACLLSRCISSPGSFPINSGVVQGHLLCASKEFPLTGKVPVTIMISSNPGEDESPQDLLSDQELFGSEDTYAEALRTLYTSGSLVKFRAPVASGGQLEAYKAHASIDKPWMRVSVRSIEPVSFSIVDISHPAQGGRTNGIHDEGAVLDNLPYSRVFYHAFPGAIILHRGQKYKVLSMTKPPPFDPCSAYRRNLKLAAFATPTQDKYLTRPLSKNTITIVKQMERVDIQRPVALEKVKEKESPTAVAEPYSDSIPDQMEGSFAGCGVVTSKRTVHGFKKLSLITRAEMSRHELSLPALEYDTFGLWIDAEAETLAPFLGAGYGSGVHALSHSLLAVAPLFIPCVRSDLECDHASYSPTRVCLFDERAGGSGTCAELWKSLFISDGLLEAAIDLLANCPSCCQEDNDLGCPACLQSGQCVKFNQFLSRAAALIIGRRMLKRLQQSDLYTKSNAKVQDPPEKEPKVTGPDGTPRKKARAEAMRHAKDLQSAKERKFVVGRPSWPTDEDNMTSPREGRRRQEKAD